VNGELVTVGVDDSNLVVYLQPASVGRGSAAT